MTAPCKSRHVDTTIEQVRESHLTLQNPLMTIKLHMKSTYTWYSCIQIH